MKLFYLIFGYFMIQPLFLCSQDREINLSFIPNFGNIPVSFDQKYPLNEFGDSISFSSLRFYVSNVQFYNQGKEVAFSKGYFLYDLTTNPTKDLKIINPSNFDLISFDIGVDSIINTLGAQVGDLDPINGMYWTWQSGYINFKLEGWSNLCKSRNSEFAYHIGGYRHPYNNLRNVRLKIPNSSDVKISMDIKTLFNSVDLSTICNLMSPNKESIHFANILPSLFSVKASNNRLILKE